MAVTKEEVSKMVKIQNETPNIDYGGGKYPLAKKWNEFIKHIEEAREIWESLQTELDIVGVKELERRYPAIAQRYLGKFRNIKFEWMMSLFVDYYRGAGRLDSMYIILPPEEKKKEKKNDSRD